MKSRWVILAVAAVVAVPSVGLAQGGRPPGGQGGMGGPGQGRGMRGPVTLGQVPLPVLDQALNLTPDQEKKIKPALDKLASEFAKLRAQMGGMGGGPGGPGGGASGGRGAPGGPPGGGRPLPGGPPPGQRPGGPPGGMAPMMGGGMSGGMQAFSQFRTLGENATKTIEGVLTPAQKQKAPAFLQELTDLRNVGIMPRVLPELKLTASQKQKLLAEAKNVQKQREKLGQNADRSKMMELMTAARTKVEGVLTAPQKAVLERNRPRGFGGGGGPGGGGPGGGRPGGGGRAPGGRGV